MGGSVRTVDGSSVTDYYEPSKEPITGDYEPPLPLKHSLEVIAHELILIRYLLQGRDL